MRWLRGLGALLLLTLILIGSPVALLSWGRLDLSVLAQPAGAGLLLLVLTLLGWIAWAVFLLSVLLEVTRLRGGGVNVLPGLQRLSAGLLLAVLALLPDPAVTQTAGAPQQAVSAEPDRDAETEANSPEVYLVEAGDDLWSISQSLFGDGSHWRELAAVNQLSDPTAQLAQGTRLVVKRISVERGDTLSGLAQEHLGSAKRWPRIAAANRHRISDPDHIEVGWQLRLPMVAKHQESDPGSADPEPSDQVDKTDGGGKSTVPDNSSNPDSPTPSAAASSKGKADEPTATSDRPAEFGATEAEPPTTSDQPDESAPIGLVLGTIGSLTAAAIVATIEARRALRLRVRGVGRQTARPPEGLTRLRTALAARQAPDRLTALDQTLRAIGLHCWQTGTPLPELERVLLTDSTINLHWATPAGPPPLGFTGDAARWEASVDDPPSGGEHPCPYPALVSLGSAAGEAEQLLVDAERSRVLAVSATADELRRSSLAAILVELACAPWSAETKLLVAGPEAGLVALAGPERVRVLPGTEAGIAELELLLVQRRAALSEPIAQLRVDPDRAEAVAPILLCLTGDEVSPALDELLAGPPVGLAVVGPIAHGAEAKWEVSGEPHNPRGRLKGETRSVLAHAVPEATRTTLARLFEAADEPATQPAWWDLPAAAEDNVLPLPKRALREDPVDIVRVVAPAQAPQLHLIGPVELTGAAGPGPTRSRQQLMEVCAWLLEHPGSTASAMAAGLLIAESTRRSNLSRLRSWLGSAADGSPYLPDAYSGRVLLHPSVTSDWQRLQVLLAPGIHRVGDETLVTALELIRGAPLADAAPGQWHWAEELRTEVSSVLRDAALVLVERALSRGDVDLARWAAARALVVAAEDELLLAARIRTEYRAGNTSEVERLVNQVTRQARILEVDLLPETVDLCQQVLEGQLRARA